MIQGVANRLWIAFVLMYRVSQKNFTDLACYLSKSVCYLLKVIKEIYYAMLILDLSISFISVSAHIDFL